MDGLYSVEMQQLQNEAQSPALKEGPSAFEGVGMASNLLKSSDLDVVLLESLNQAIARTEEDPPQDGLPFAGNSPDGFIFTADPQMRSGREEALVLEILSAMSEDQTQDEAIAMQQESDQPSSAIVVPYVSPSKSEHYPSRRRRKRSAREQVLEEKRILEGEDESAQDFFEGDPAAISSQCVVEIQGL